MPPKVKYQKEEIVNAALNVAKEKGIDAVTAREVAKELRVSVGPIFTWFESMDALKADVYEQAKGLYRGYIEQGLEEEIPFLGVWHQYMRFAREEPELYKLLFLTKPGAASGGATEALTRTAAQNGANVILIEKSSVIRESLMRTYHMDAHTADCYFRDIWLIGFSFATLAVTDDCPYTDEEIFAVGAEVSLAVCKAYKEIPGLPEGKYDRDAIFRELVKR